MRDDSAPRDEVVPWEFDSNGWQRVGWLAGLPRLVRELNGDAEALLRRVGLEADVLEDPEGFVRYVAVPRLLDAAAQATQCAHFGLLAGRLCHVSAFGVLGELMRHAPTVGIALRSFTEYQHLDSGGALVFLLERGGFVDLGYAIFHPGVRSTAQLYDCAISACFGVVAELCGPEWFPTDVLIPHERPGNVAQYRNLFKVTPRFDAEHCAIRFPAHWMERRLAGGDPGRHRDVLARVARAGRGELLQQVYRAVRMLLLHGRNSGDDVAKTLLLHRRTFNRRLRALGTTYQEVLDHVRHEVGRHLLCDSHIPLDDIAAALGYNGVSPFQRAFRRWTGTTPGYLRRQLQRPAAAPMSAGAPASSSSVNASADACPEKISLRHRRPIASRIDG